MVQETEDYSKVAEPEPHATTHQSGGTDEINVAGLSGELADPQPPKTHATSHQNGGTDEINVAGLSGKLADLQDAGWVKGKIVDDTAIGDQKALIYDQATDSIVYGTVAGAGDTITDRGDPSAIDFTKADFITDGSWHDLDLSAIVPAGAKFVSVHVHVNATSAGATMRLRKNGNVNEANNYTVATPAADLRNDGYFWVPCDENQVIEYRADNVTWNTLEVHVMGWVT